MMCMIAKRSFSFRVRPLGEIRIVSIVVSVKIKRVVVDVFANVTAFLSMKKLTLIIQPCLIGVKIVFRFCIEIKSEFFMDELKQLKKMGILILTRLFLAIKKDFCIVLQD